MLKPNLSDFQDQSHGTQSHKKEFLRVMLQQVYFTFIQAMPLVVIIASIVGAAVAFQTRFTLSFVGTDGNKLGEILVFVLFRELTPLITALLVIARSITAVSSELATMTVQREIEALEFIGIDINQFLLAPRIAAGVISLFCLSFCFWLISLAGSWISINWFSYWPIDRFLSVIAGSLMPSDIFFFILKSFFTGAIVFYMAARTGLKVKGASFEVPIMTNKAVVDALFVAMGIQILLSLIFYLSFGVKI